MKRKLLGIVAAAVLLAPSPAYAVDLNAHIRGYFGIQIGLCHDDPNWPSGRTWLPCWWI